MSEVKPPSSREMFSIAALLVVFVTFNLLTAARYPFVWIDEVMYSDPAINAASGNGFDSTMWYAQREDGFWAGNVPLHSALLTGWLKLTGVSITAVRCVNLFYMAAACLLIWRACLRSGLVLASRHRLLALVLVLTGYSLVFSYRSGRPDCLGLLAMSGLFYALTLERKSPALALMFALGFLLPWIGLQLLPMLAVAGVLLVLFVGRQVFGRVTAAALGAGSGLVALVLFYKSHGVWESFLRSINQHTAGGFLGLLLGGDFKHSNLTPKDFSFVPLFALAAWMVFAGWRRGNLRVRSPLVFGLVFVVALSLALLVSGKFPTYYGWMTFVPLVICVCSFMASRPVTGSDRIVRVTLLSLTIIVGIGPHFVAVSGDWPERDPARVEQFVRENVRADDRAYCDFGAYYAVKKHAAQVVGPMYPAVMNDDEKRKLTVLVIHPRHFVEVTNAVGGVWIASGAELVPEKESVFGTDWRGGFLAMQNYRFTIYRRAQLP